MLERENSTHLLLLKGLISMEEYQQIRGKLASAREECEEGTQENQPGSGGGAGAGVGAKERTSGTATHSTAPGTSSARGDDGAKLEATLNTFGPTSIGDPAIYAWEENSDTVTIEPAH